MNHKQSRGLIKRDSSTLKASKDSNKITPKEVKVIQPTRERTLSPLSWNFDFVNFSSCWNTRRGT